MGPGRGERLGGAGRKLGQQPGGQRPTPRVPVMEVTSPAVAVPEKTDASAGFVRAGNRQPRAREAVAPRGSPQLACPVLLAAAALKPCVMTVPPHLGGAPL